MKIVVTRAVRSSGGADHHPRIVCVGSGAGPASNGAGPTSNGAGCAPPTVDERRDERTSSAVVSSRLLFSS
jgi:hypothetical protein